MRIRDWDANLKVRLFGEALMNITFWMFFPFLAIYFSDEFGKETAGLFLIAAQVFSVFANLLGGYSADRFGRKKMMVLASVGQGISFIVFGIAVSPAVDMPSIAFVCFALAGVFGALYWPASQAMIADVVPEKDRSDVFAVFYTSLNIAVVLGPILGSIFYVQYKVELLVVSGLVCMLLAFILFKWTRETAPLVLEKSDRPEQFKWYHAIRSQVKDYGVIFRDKTFMLYILAGVLGAQTFMQLDLLMPVYIKEMISNETIWNLPGWDLTVNGEQSFGIVLSENGLLVAIFTISVTRWMTRYRERNVFILSSVFYAISILWFGQMSSTIGFLGAMALFTFAELMTAGLQQSFISRIAPEDMRGQYFAAASLRFTIGRTIAPLSIPMTVWFGYNWTFIILSVLACAGAVLYYVMFQRYDNPSAKGLNVQG
ncbi:MFS transporter [Bacillus sp. FJAT-42376]|uniref:MDR family MFS transporter n=1 Tax=Bacillus sp. FJAT-42376 TaxID=2014076 RepID=UPI000F514158|nr:MFS transporter [Bacillus sp. FJAT-42376]AZB41649.1 MFS transporter [Bacillus sp. FJAT-42376]